MGAAENAVKAVTVVPSPLDGSPLWEPGEAMPLMERAAVLLDPAYAIEGEPEGVQSRVRELVDLVWSLTDNGAWGDPFLAVARSHYAATMQ